MTLYDYSIVLSDRIRWLCVLVCVLSMAWFMKQQAFAESETASSDRFHCELPNVPVNKSTSCDNNSRYPLCKWQLPSEKQAKGLFQVWKRTGGLGTLGSS